MFVLLLFQCVIVLLKLKHIKHFAYIKGTTYLYRLEFCITGLLSNDTIHALEITHQAPMASQRAVAKGHHLTLSICTLTDDVAIVVDNFSPSTGILYHWFTFKWYDSCLGDHTPSPHGLSESCGQKATIFHSASVSSQIIWPSLLTTFLHQLGFCITGSIVNQHQSSSPSNLRRWTGSTLLINENKYSWRKDWSWFKWYNYISPLGLHSWENHSTSQVQVLMCYNSQSFFEFVATCLPFHWHVIEHSLNLH